MDWMLVPFVREVFLVIPPTVYLVIISFSNIKLVEASYWFIKRYYNIEYKLVIIKKKEDNIMKVFNIINEKVTPYSKHQDIKSAKLDKYKMVIVGESHSNSMVGIYNKLLSQSKYDYLLAEFAYDDKALTREDIKYKMDHATNGGMGPCDYQYNYWLYELAYKYNIPLIGIDRGDTKKFKSREEEFKTRETIMINTIQQYSGKGRCLVQIGDAHVRSIPISKEYIKQYNYDDEFYEGNIDNQTVSFVSPIYKKYANDPNVMIFRIKKEYEDEQRFLRENS